MKRCAFVLIAVGLAWAVGPAPATAESDCTAKCSRACSGADCGAASVTCASLRSRPEKSACLDLLGAPSEEARWLLVETEPVPGARDHALRVRFASSPLFEEQIEACHQQGLLPDYLFDAGLTRTFRFVPPRGTFQMSGRRLRLNVPPGEAGGLSGQVAVELVVDPRGGVQSKELLFATDTALGQRVLDGIGRWTEVASSGDAPGPYMDVLYLAFGADGLEVALQNHYSLTAADSKTRLASRR